MAQVFGNNLSTALTAPITALDTNLPIVIASGDAFPQVRTADDDFFLVTLIGLTGLQETSWEVIKVTDIGPNNLAVVERGQEGTTAQTWPSGTRIEMRLTAGISSRHEETYGWGDHSTAGYITSSGSITGNAATATTATNVTGISRNVGDYGSISADTTQNGYYGFSCNGHLVLMSNGSFHGIYDDVQNEWWMQFYENAGVTLHYNGDTRIESTSAGASITGALTASGNVTAYSDKRLKSDIETLDGSKVYSMRGVSFTKDGEASSGVIAQELQEVAPELVREGEEYLSVAYGNLVGYLIEAVKGLKAEIEELKEAK